MWDSWKLLAPSCLAFVLAACGGGGGGNGDGKSYYKDKYDFGKPLNTTWLALPGGRGLRSQALRYVYRDLVGELEDYSAPDQAAQVPNAPQDISSLGVAGRYMSAEDLVVLNQNFPAGLGSVGYTVRGSMTPLIPGQYMFVSAEFESDLEFERSSKTLDYAAVFKRTLDPANDWAGNSTFTRDTFIGSDWWVRVAKGEGEEPRLIVNEIEGTTINDVTDSGSMAVINGNSLLFILPMLEFPGRLNYPPVRVTSFDNIDGNFGRFNDDGWSLDTAPSRDEPYFVPNFSATARYQPRVELDVRYISTTRDLIADLGLSRDQSWPLQETTDPNPGVANASMTDFAIDAGLFGGGQMLGTLVPGDAARGTPLPYIFDTTMGIGNFGVFPGLPGDFDVPFDVTGRDQRDVSGIGFDTNFPTFSSTTPLRGDVLGTTIPPGQLAQILEMLEQLDSPAPQVMIEPRLIALNGQSLSVLGVDWTTPVDNLQPTIRDYYNNVDSTITEARTGLSLNLRPRIVDGDRVELTLTPTVSALAEPNSPIQVDGVDMRVAIPFVETRNIETTVQLRNGETVVLGGLMEQGQSTVQDGVPWLGDIPILDKLFASTTNDVKKSELVIFITPRIVRQE